MVSKGQYLVGVQPSSLFDDSFSLVYHDEDTALSPTQ